MSTIKDIKDIIESIVKDNTGINFLDSGFENGRHWQRNQNREVNFEGYIIPDECGHYPIPIEFFMFNFFSIDKQTDIFNECLKSKDSYLWTGEATETLKDNFDICLSGYLCCEGNTYNNDNDLSQDFQFQTFEYEDEFYCIFQLHNGADARGGYTNSYVFKLDEFDREYFFNWQVDFYCPETGSDYCSVYMLESEGAVWDNEKQVWVLDGNEVYANPIASCH